MCWTKTRCNLIRATLIFIYTFVVFAHYRHTNTHYILIWTNPRHFTYPSLQKGNKSFVHNQCSHQNCFVSNKYVHVAKNLSQYDAILFNAVTLRIKPSIQLPKKHAENQKYILISRKSAADFPVSDKYNNFFHWTWTYQLKSDISNAYIVIKDKEGKVIGPKEDMQWITTEEMNRVKANIISKLQFKTTAAAWITSCKHRRQYDTYIRKLKTELEKHNHTLDIFGTCGDRNCPDSNIKKCYTLLQSKYYFYLSFEDSMAEDYVTDRLLIALNNFAVPLVFGGANYTRFMPEGIYLNALELGPTKLANKMNEIIGNRKVYYDMFKWHSYYSFHNPYDNPDTNGICKLCDLLNNKIRRAETKVYENIVTWFNDRKDWKMEDEKEEVKIKHVVEKDYLSDFDDHLSQNAIKQNIKETLIHINRNKIDQTIDKPESQDIKNYSEAVNLQLEKHYEDKEANKLTTSSVYDKSFEANSEDFAEVIQMRNIVKNEIYNDIGLPNTFLGLDNENEKVTAVDINKEIDNITYSAGKESLIDLIRRLENENITETEFAYSTEVYNTTKNDFSDLHHVSYIEQNTSKQLQRLITNNISIQQTTKTQQQQTTTIIQDNDTIEEQLKKENEILKETLNRFEAMIMLNKQQFRIRNISTTTETRPMFSSGRLPADMMMMMTTETEIYRHDSYGTDNQGNSSTISHIGTTDNNNNQTQKLDYVAKKYLRAGIKPIKEQITIISTKTHTATTKPYNFSNNDNVTISTTEINEHKNQYYKEDKNRLFNILIWTNSKQNPFYSKNMGTKLFNENNCEFQNCLLSNQYSNYTNITNYDAVMFDTVALQEQPFLELPQQRDERQKYVLVSRVSATNYPITTKYNYFFNWTWTYKLDSDISLSYIVIKDKNGKILGPAKNMHWMLLDKMDEPNEQIIKKLQNKSTAAAWVMPDCQTINKYEFYITDFRNELRKYDHVLNIFGQCGNMKCLNNELEQCYALLETEYYFYLSFEDSMAEDYVTDQLLIALDHLVVPLVFGGANYTRFMPDGIYLNALELGPAKLARKVSDIIRKRKSYNDMFRWHNYYSYHNPLDDPSASGICEMCALLNDDQRRKETTVYKNIVKWFNDRKDWNIRQERITLGVLGAADKENTSSTIGSMKKYTNDFIKIPTKGTHLLINQDYNINFSNEDDNIILFDTQRGRGNVPYDYESMTTLGMAEPGIVMYNTQKDNQYLDQRPAVKKRRHKEKVETPEAKDTSIRCPDIQTCFNTIVSKIQSKIASINL